MVTNSAWTGDAAQGSRSARQRFGRWLLVMHLAGIGAVGTLAMRVPVQSPARPAAAAAGASEAADPAGQPCCPEDAAADAERNPVEVAGSASGRRP